MGKLKEILIKLINKMVIVKIIKIKVNQNMKSKKNRTPKKKMINLMKMRKSRKILEIVKHLLVKLK